MLHKQGSGSDHLAIAWTLPGNNRTLIPVSAMETFDISAPVTTEGLTHQIFDNIVGSYVADLTSASRFPHSPDRTSIIVSGQGPVNAGDNMGTRTSGWIVPQVSGDYTFWVCGDGRVDLLLSPTSNPADTAKVASCGGATSQLQWTKYASQKSRTLTLTAGNAYYIEILQKESTGTDHFAVAWTPPGGALEILPGTALRTWAPHPTDLDDDKIADAQEAVLGLDPAVATDGYADLDDDGIPNFREYAQFNQPGLLDSVNGYINDHVWFNIPGDKLNSSCYKAAATRPFDERFFMTTTQSIDVGENYVRRHRGYITAPLTGQYQFWLTADDDGDFYLSTSSSKYDLVQIIRNDVLGGAFRGFDIDPSQKSVLITLQAGQKYYFELWHKEYTMSGDAAVAWKIPGGSRQIISSNYLSSFALDSSDLDDDDIPDAYEIANGLDPQDAGRSSGSNQGAYGDFDGDGLTNREEWKNNTAANLIDTDGDGVSDYDEVNFFGSATLANDIGPFVPVANLNGDSYIASFGDWIKSESKAMQDCRRGSVTYPVSVQVSGVYAFKFDISSIVDGNQSEQYEFDLKLNGKRIAYKTINILPDGSAILAVLSPWINAGETYNLELFVDNSYNFRRVSINSLQVLAAGGTDSNDNGTPDWVEIRMHDTNGFDNIATLSKTSPATVEGKVGHYAFLNTGGASVSQAPNGRFFTEVILTPGSPATLDFSFENGAVTQTSTIQWCPTNLLQEANLTLRKGDSLLLTAYQDAENASLESYTLVINGQTYEQSADQPSQVLFNNAGTTTIQLTHTDANALVTTRTINVDVLPLVTIESPHCVVGYPRSWVIPALPTGAKLQIDNKISSLETAANTYTLATATPINEPMLIRHGVTGPILGYSEVRSVCIRSDDLTGNLAIEFYPTYDLVELPIVMQGDLGDVVIRCEIIIGGVTFPDGSTVKDVGLSSFDEYGVSKLQYLTPRAAHSNCHRYSVWHNNTRIAYYY